MTLGVIGRAATAFALAGALVGLAPAGASAAMLGTWDADGNVRFMPGVVGLGLNRGSGVAVGNGASQTELNPIVSGVGSGRFSTQGWTNGTQTAEDALAANDFIAWRVVSDIGLDLDVLHLNVDTDVASAPGGFLNEEADGPPMFALLASVDGGAFVSVLMAEGPDTPTAFQADLSVLPVGNTVDFRLVGFGFDEVGRFGELRPERTELDLVADPNFGSLGDFNSVVAIEGAIIPLPGALPLFLTALGLGAVIARRRNRSGD